MIKHDHRFFAVHVLHQTLKRDPSAREEDPRPPDQRDRIVFSHLIIDHMDPALAEELVNIRIRRLCIVIPEHSVHTVTRLHLFENRLDLFLILHLIGTSVIQDISRDHDQVRMAEIHLSHHFPEVLPADRRADMQIREMHDPVREPAVQLCASQAHRYDPDPMYAPVTVRDDQERSHGCRH